MKGGGTLVRDWQGQVIGVEIVGRCEGGVWLPGGGGLLLGL